jgi:ABC-type uncharacterized transport system substrate-binding protein
MLPMQRIWVVLLSFCVWAESVVEGHSHPHVWVTSESSILYRSDGAITGIRHRWTFDEMYSAFALQGIETKKRGVFTREELAPLATINVESLHEFDFFTFATANGRKLAFRQPVDYWLDHANDVLTLNFTLPFRTPLHARALDLEIHDPMFFVFLVFAKKTPVQVVGGPANCKMTLKLPSDEDLAQTRTFSESFFDKLTLSNRFGARFANKVELRCP